MRDINGSDVCKFQFGLKNGSNVAEWMQVFRKF